MMLKNILLLIGLSVVAIFFQNELVGVLHFFMKIHDQIAKGLGAIFSLNAVGEIVQSVLALLLIPAAIGVIIAIAHFFIKQQHFPHTLHVVWVCWAVFLTAILSQTGHVTNQSAEEIRAARQQVAQAKTPSASGQSQAVTPPATQKV